MKKMKQAAAGLLVLGVFTAGACAGAALNAQLSPDIKVVVDGQPRQITDAYGQKTAPITFNSTTYLPIRSVAELCGREVGWDGGTRTITLDEKGAAAPQTAYSRTNPAPIGTVQSMLLEDYEGTANISIRVLSSERGDSAWAKLKQANSYNSAPPAGKEYVLVRLRASVNSVSDDRAISLSSYSFTPFSGQNTEYDSTSAVEPEPMFSGEAYAGGTIEGYAAYLVDADDPAPKLAFGRDWSGKGGLWFAI